jgi:hypothetical protein
MPPPGQETVPGDLWVQRFRPDGRATTFFKACWPYLGIYLAQSDLFGPQRYNYLYLNVKLSSVGATPRETDRGMQGIAPFNSISYGTTGTIS